MKKKTQTLLTLLWGLAAAGSRVLYFFLNKQSAGDTYEYLANAMIWTTEGDLPLSSGLAYAYTKNLSWVLGGAENRIETVCFYQMLLQILWIILLAVGISMVFGKLAGIVSSTILAAMPMVLSSMITVSPENFYMLHLSLNVIILGVFLNRTRNVGWYRSNLCELYLMISGFYLGVICTWNYVGWCLLAVIIYILKQNHLALRVGLLEQKFDEERDVKDQLMGAGSQAFILIVGIAVGMYATLMKYTGLTGKTIVDQFIWWILQFGSLPDRCQDVSSWLIVVLTGAVLAGLLLKRLAKIIQNKKEEKIILDTIKKEQEKNIQKEKIQVMPEEEKEDGYVVTEDGRRIKLLDNPLPVPKKHVKREIGFDIDESKVNEGRKDFDFDVNENDDFDY